MGSFRGKLAGTINAGYQEPQILRRDQHHGGVGYMNESSNWAFRDSWKFALLLIFLSIYMYTNIQTYTLLHALFNECILK